MALRLVLVSLLVGGNFAAYIPFKNHPLNGRIIGGSDASEGLYPYQVSVQFQGSHICSGSIVHPEWVITAAHCIAKLDGFTVVAGSNKLSIKGDVYKVLEVHIHPKYNKTELNNDVAILKAEPITFNKKVSKISVETQFVDEERATTLSGWGKTKLAYPDNLQHIELRTITVKTCLESHSSESNINDSKICTLRKGEEGACFGDSASSLIQGKADDRVLIGIVAWPMTCTRGVPDVYSRLSYHLFWFNKICDNCINQ